MRYVLGIDTWEGNPNIDETKLHEVGVEFIIPRLNDMQGGHHVDSYFATQWAQSESFIRLPYAVYNPWVDGLTNFNWFMAHIPQDATAIALDVEVKYLNYPPLTYAQQVDICTRRLKAEIPTILYSGSWFKDYLSYWPAYVEDWWARYPGYLYPAESQHITWEELIEKLDNLLWNPGVTPNGCRMWQCTADRYYLPGCSTKLDINIWNGTRQELVDFVNGTPPPPPALPRAVSTRGTLINYRDMELRDVGDVVGYEIPVIGQTAEHWIITGKLAKSVTTAIK